MIEWVKEEENHSRDGKLDTTREIEIITSQDTRGRSPPGDVAFYLTLTLDSHSSPVLPIRATHLHPFRLRDFRLPYLGRPEAMTHS